VANAFSAMLRRKRTTLALALEAIDVYEEIPIRFVEVESEQSLRLADSLGIYAYDAYLIRCAQKYRSPLLSIDAYLAERARRTRVQVLEVGQ
jgi:predicted nucleic acid-binding protein